MKSDGTISGMASRTTMMTANTTARPINRCRSKRPLSEKAKVTPRLNEGRTLFGKPRSGFLRSRDLRSMGRRRTAIAAADHLKQYRLGKVRLILGCLDRQHQSEPDPAEMLNATAPRRGSGCPTDFSNGQTSAALQPDPRCRRRGSWRPGTFRRGRDTCCGAEPMVRIHLPPAASQTNFRSVRLTRAEEHDLARGLGTATPPAQHAAIVAHLDPAAIRTWQARYPKRRQPRPASRRRPAQPRRETKTTVGY